MKTLRVRSGRPLAVGIVTLAAALLTQATYSADAARATEPSAVVPLQEMMLVHPSVVDPFLNGGRSDNGGPADLGGIWSLRTLLENINLGGSASARNDFYTSLFEQWLTDQTTDNGALVSARNASLVSSLLLNPFSSVDPATGKRVYQLWKLPFELIAIVYRPDLRSSDGTDGGELRFVYKLIGPDGSDLKLTLNLEYSLRSDFWDTPASTARSWANNFHRLSTLPVGSEEYLRTLEGMTFYVTSPLYDSYTETAIKHIRTNELAFDPAGVTWQMREFVVSHPTFTKTVVVASSVDDTPSASLNGTQQLVDFITQNPTLSAAGTAFLQPEGIAHKATTSTFLAGFSNTSNNPNGVGVKWSAPGQSAVAVDNLGLLTCNGCHQDNKMDAAGTMHIPGEVNFYHIQPDVEPGQTGESRLSKFLTTADPDPTRAARRPGELARRKAELEQLLALSWSPTWLNLYYP